MSDRPIECSECKKEISCHYTCVDLLQKNTINVCADCPILEKYLHGASTSSYEVGEGVSAMGLCCGQCGTKLESVRLGGPLGCPECYEIFSDILILEMQKHEKGVTPSSGAFLHIGRTPGEDTKTNPALRLLALNKALSETLNREDYEQAAWLRDQIKILSDTESGKGVKDND